jgi:nucleotide-binding universal stress UspA family protein
MIKDLLVHMDASQAGERRLAYAFDLAERSRARLTAIHVTAPADVSPRFKPSEVTRIATTIASTHAEQALTAAAVFRDMVPQRTVAARWRSSAGDMAECISRQAHCADLVVLGQYEAQSPPEHHPLSLAEEVVLHAGRPILVVPDATSSWGPTRRALIAWDGSRAATRAVHDALPLLCGVGVKVEIATVNQSAGHDSAEALADHLARHRIALDGAVHLRSERSIGESLANRLKDGQFDLLVMGAYGHPVWLEFLAGGTTLSALNRATTPVLISH